MKLALDKRARSVIEETDLSQAYAQPNKMPGLLHDFIFLSTIPVGISILFESDIAPRPLRIFWYMYTFVMYFSDPLMPVRVLTKPGRGFEDLPMWSRRTLAWMYQIGLGSAVGLGFSCEYLSMIREGREIELGRLCWASYMVVTWFYGCVFLSVWYCIGLAKIERMLFDLLL